MTPEQHTGDGENELIEDLDAPAAAQADVAGGKVACADPTCVGPGTSIDVFCNKPTCAITRSACGEASRTILVYEQ